MGKYMRKAKVRGDVAVTEAVSQSLGVRTRAKTLALRRLQSARKDDSSSYLQLRSRRLEKLPPSLNGPEKQSQQQERQQSRIPEVCAEDPNPSSRMRPRPMNSGSIGSVSVSRSKIERVQGVAVEFSGRGSDEGGTEGCNDLGMEFEPSFGENNLELDARERSTRESTPCSLIRQLDAVGTPGSTTKQTAQTAMNQRIQNSLQRNVPTNELEDFFAQAERQQQLLFTEKYNFDVVNDLPLPGRYKWVRVSQ
ncbi:cyclin-dependent kinase inhibitor 5-like [Diospyros lotus]|uniref:cyclin-dependent kinase inhibitor 5-like n=1 Tax=Diospyros lotus TaxID=55363 RepID=UPI0022543C69|nr:cyclin-dependent kinase inhibitor 5-like [Diospyros lotus]